MMAGRLAATTPPNTKKSTIATNGSASTMIVRGQVPMSELSGYQSRLNAMTSGQGRYTLALSHYQAVPPAVQQQLVGQYQAKDDD